MKKLLALLFALLLCVMAACSPAPNETPGESTEPSKETEPQYETITIAQALELCGAEGNITEERYYIRAKVESISNPTYGSMVISDETGSISVYGTYSEDGEIPYGQMTDKPYKGDEVLLHCILQNYNGTKEVKNARLIQFTHAKVEVDESEYTEMSIADAAMLAGNDSTLEHLDTLTGAFLDLYVHTNGVAHPNLGQLFLHVLAGQSLYQIHNNVLLIY